MSSLEEFAKAIERGNSSMVESLVLRGAVDANAYLPRSLRPALIRASELGHKDIVDILLRANARVDDTDESGRTACHAAAQGDHCGVLALLLARQPNLAAVDVNGKTSFCFALKSCHNDDGRCALMLLEAGASLERADPFHLCRFAATSTAAIQALIDRGVVVRELRTFDDCTPLHGRMALSDADVFEMLVNVCGIDLEARDCKDQTCLHSAARDGNVFSLRWLLNAGADLDSVTADGLTPLHYANFHNDAVILLAAGADVCARDNRGRTALHRWTARGLLNELPSLFPLIAAGADLDAVDDGGNTCRQLLARRQLTIDPEKVEAARRDIAKARIDFVRYRALEVCIGLQSLRLDALQVCEILQFACGPSAPLIPFHIWWTIATTVKHFFKMK
jgi:ankyrin repeat protein